MRLKSKKVDALPLGLDDLGRVGEGASLLQPGAFLSKARVGGGGVEVQAKSALVAWATLKLPLLSVPGLRAWGPREDTWQLPGLDLNSQS